MLFKRGIPLFICFIFGVLMTLQGYVPSHASKAFKSELAAFVKIIAAFSLGLGLVSVCRLHGQRIRRGMKGWGYSIIMFVGLLGMAGAGFWYKGEDSVGDALTAFGWGYMNVLRPLQATMFSVLAFFIASAAYRAFRARTKEATLLLVTALIVMLGRVPMGDWIWNRIGGQHAPFSLSQVVVWIMGVPNMAAQRGIGFGLTLGIIATSLKIIFGIERAYLGGKD